MGGGAWQNVENYAIRGWTAIVKIRVKTDSEYVFNTLINRKFHFSSQLINRGAKRCNRSVLVGRGLLCRTGE